MTTMFPSDSPAYETSPTIKAEYSAGPQGGAQRYTMRTAPWDALQLANLQKRYGRKPGETETGYLWRVYLSGSN